MNKEIDPVRDHGHPATQPGCRHWASIFESKLDDTARPALAPAEQVADGEPTPAPD